MTAVPPASPAVAQFLGGTCRGHAKAPAVPEHSAICKAFAIHTRRSRGKTEGRRSGQAGCRHRLSDAAWEVSAGVECSTKGRGQGGQGDDY